jgi:competence protein ComFC
MSLLDLLFPKKCLNCGKSGNYLCVGCQKLIPWHSSAVCLVCGKRAIGGYSHPVCLGKWGLDRSILLSHYSGPMRRLIQGLKYKRLTDEKNLLVDLALSRLDRREFQGFVATAVPLHFTRHLSRGFNQSELLAKGLAGRLNILYKDNILYRSSNTSSQVGLSKKERRSNVGGAFKIYDPKAIKNSKILLIDDVVTTGATVRECAKVLKRSGAKEVWALALAHG